MYQDVYIAPCVLEAGKRFNGGPKVWKLDSS